MTTFYGRKNVHMSIQPNIGLDASTRQAVIEILTTLLADEAVLSQKTRHACTEAKEIDVPGLRSLYEAQSKKITASSREIMERIQILGGSHAGESKEPVEAARLEREFNAVPDIVNILAGQEAFIRFLREDARKCAEMYEDQGTFVLLVRILSAHEKMAWILRSNFLSSRIEDEK